jgi:hypothetical protein
VPKQGSEMVATMIRLTASFAQLLRHGTFSIGFAIAFKSNNCNRRTIPSLCEIRKRKSSISTLALILTFSDRSTCLYAYPHLKMQKLTISQTGHIAQQLPVYAAPFSLGSTPETSLNGTHSNGKDDWKPLERMIPPRWRLQPV